MGEMILRRRLFLRKLSLISGVCMILFVVVMWSPWKPRDAMSVWYSDILNGNLKAELVRVKNRMKHGSYLTERLWTFTNANTERLFLYKELLSREWTSNVTNLHQVRRELEEIGIHATDDLAITRQNTHLHSSLPFYISKKGETYTVTDKFLKTLPENAPFRNQSLKRCAVVGNSGNLLKSSCGEEIDSYDMIFRCNAAPIAQYAKDAGWKSNITTFNPSILFKRYNQLKTLDDFNKFRANITQYHGFIWLTCFGSVKLHKICLLPLLNDIPRQPDEPTLLISNPNQFARFWDFWKARKITKVPSTGFFMTHAALQLCDETHLYGFWPFPLRLDSQFERVPYHYFDDIVVSKYHGMSDEFSVFVQYHEFGVIRLHTDKCHGNS